MSDDKTPFEPPSLAGLEPVEHFHEVDTVRPPPMNFELLGDSAKLDWICHTLQHVSDAQIAFQQNLAVLNARIGVVDGEDGGPSLFTKLTDVADELRGVTRDVDKIREYLIGKGASIHEFQRAEEERRTATATTPPDRPRGG